MSEFDVELALKLNAAVHKICSNAPHDSGIKLAEIVRVHQLNYSPKPDVSERKQLLKDLMDTDAEHGMYKD